MHPEICLFKSMLTGYKNEYPPNITCLQYITCNTGKSDIISCTSSTTSASGNKLKGIQRGMQ